MFCIHCGREIFMSEVSFCPYCGRSLDAELRQTDAERPADQSAYCDRRPRRTFPFRTAMAVLLATVAVLAVAIALSSFEPTVDLVAEDGVSEVSGDGTYSSGDVAFVTAYVENGYTFLGWYTDGAVESVNSAFLFEVTKSVKLHAFAEREQMAWAESDTLHMASPVGSAIGTSWKVTDRSGAVVFTGEGHTESCTLPDGVYSVTVTSTVFGTDYERTESVGVGMMEKKFRWYYDWKAYSLSLPVSFDIYEDYRYKNPYSRAPTTDWSTAAFVTSEAPEIRDLAERLLAMSSDMTDQQRADFVLKFVQSTDYVSDMESRGANEWFKYPYETLYDNNGDCEDTSILYCALMEAMGYDTVLLKYTVAEGYAPGEGHMACAVAVDMPWPATYYTHDGTRYYFCETTNSSDVGEIGDKYDRARIIHVD